MYSADSIRSQAELAGTRAGYNPTALKSASKLAHDTDPAVQAERQAKLKEACRMFEAQFLKLLWKEMRKTVQKGGMMGGGYGEELFTSMLDQAISDASVKGRSMGLADMLEKQLSIKTYKHPAGRKAARTAPADASATAPAAAPAAESPRTSSMASPVEGVVSSPFGPRIHPITGRLTPHNGVDIAAKTGSPVMAAQSGVVNFAGEKGGYGNLVVITHPDGSQTRYGHLERIKVKQGDAVEQGQVIASVGETGATTGPHLHFEVRGPKGAARDPLPLLA